MPTLRERPAYLRCFCTLNNRLHLLRWDALLSFLPEKHLEDNYYRLYLYPGINLQS